MENVLESLKRKIAEVVDTTRDYAENIIDPQELVKAYSKVLRRTILAERAPIEKGLISYYSESDSFKEFSDLMMKDSLRRELVGRAALRDEILAKELGLPYVKKDGLIERYLN